MRIKPGDRVKDKITGLAGIVVCRTEWLYGCVRITIQPEETKDGKAVESYTIDEQQTALLERQVIVDEPDPPIRTETEAEQKSSGPAGDRPELQTWKIPER